MRPRQIPSPQLLSLADRQGGMVSIEQAEFYGLSRSVAARLIAEGRWRRPCPGLLYLHDLEPDWVARAWGGILLGGDGARLGGSAAAHLWELEDAAPDDIIVLIPHRRRLRPRSGYVFQRECVGTRSRSTGEPSRTSLVDTVIDCCNELDLDGAVDLVFKAIQSRWVTPAQLTAGIKRRTKVRHRALLLAVLAETAEGAESKLEVRFLQDVERAHGLPAGRRQARNGVGDVRDIKYDPYGLVVELDGRKGHEDMGRFRDMARDNRAVVAGEVTLRYGWPDVTGQPCAVMIQVATLLIELGWAGIPSRCSRCQAVPDHLWGNM